MDLPVEGGCDCRHVRYQMLTAPLVVNCCHCRWCQRETGGAFAVNAVIEADRVALVSGEPHVVDTPSHSGYGQRIARCPRCWVALWSHYAGSGPATKAVRVGTLDEPDLFPPQAHVYVASKQPWVQIPAGVPQFAEFYQPEQVWPPDSLQRRAAIWPRIEAWRATRTKQSETGASPPIAELNQQFEPIGVVAAVRAHAEDDFWGGEQACITLAERFAPEALQGLAEFSHVELLFLFHEVDQAKIVHGARHPRNNAAWPAVGIFAQRGKNRPNRIGSTICRIIRIAGAKLFVAELDAINGTPVLDIKPVMAEFLPRQPVRQPAWSHELMQAYWAHKP